jgi:hypothetical protein
LRWPFGFKFLGNDTVARNSEQDEFYLQELIAAGVVLKDRKATFMP